MERFISVCGNNAVQVQLNLNKSYKDFCKNNPEIGVVAIEFIDCKIQSGIYLATMKMICSNGEKSLNLHILISVAKLSDEGVLSGLINSGIDNFEKNHDGQYQSLFSDTKAMPEEGQIINVTPLVY